MVWYVISLCRSAPLNGFLSPNMCLSVVEDLLLEFFPEEKYTYSSNLTEKNNEFIVTERILFIKIKKK